MTKTSLKGPVTTKISLLILPAYNYMLYSDVFETKKLITSNVEYQSDVLSSVGVSSPLLSQAVGMTYNNGVRTEFLTSKYDSEGKFIQHLFYC